MTGMNFWIAHTLNLNKSANDAFLKYKIFILHIALNSVLKALVNENLFLIKKGKIM